MPIKHKFLWLSANLAILVAFMCSTYFMTGFATSKIELIIAVGMACFVTAWATDMLNVVESLLKNGDIALGSLVALILLPATLVYETHGVLGTTTSFNQNFEKNSDFAAKQKIAFDLSVETIKNNSSIDVNQVNKEINNLILLNNELINKPCKKGDWSCRAKANSEIENNSNLIEVKKHSLLIADNEGKRIDNARKIINKSLNNKDDWQTAHEVFKAGAIAILSDVTKAKDFQGQLLTYFAFLVSILAIVLPHLAKKLCYEKGELENIPTLSRIGNPLLKKIKKSIKNSPLKSQAHKTVFGFDFVDDNSFNTDSSVSNPPAASVSTVLDTSTATASNTRIDTPVRINSVSIPKNTSVSKQQNNTSKRVSKPAVRGVSNGRSRIEIDDALVLIHESYPSNKGISHRNLKAFFETKGYQMSQPKLNVIIQRLAGESVK